MHRTFTNPAEARESCEQLTKELTELEWPKGTLRYRVLLCVVVNWTLKKEEGGNTIDLEKMIKELWIELDQGFEFNEERPDITYHLFDCVEAAIGTEW